MKGPKTLGPPLIPAFVQRNYPIAEEGSNGLAPAATAASDMVGRAALFSLVASYVSYCCRIVLYREKALLHPGDTIIASQVWFQGYGYIL